MNSFPMNLFRVDEFHRCMLLNSFSLSVHSVRFFFLSRLYFAHQDTTTSQPNCFNKTFTIICVIFHFIVFSNNFFSFTFISTPPSRHSLSMRAFLAPLYHRRKLRKQINNSRKINTHNILQASWEKRCRKKYFTLCSFFISFSFAFPPLASAFESFYSGIFAARKC